MLILMLSNSVALCGKYMGNLHINNKLKLEMTYNKQHFSTVFCRELSNNLGHLILAFTNDDTYKPDCLILYNEPSRLL